MQSIYWNENCVLYWQGVQGDFLNKVRSGFNYVGDTVSATGHAYMYGSKIIRRGRDNVYFYNGGLPAGSAVYKWDMVFSYGSAHAIPALPLLIPGHRYLFKLWAESNKPSGLYVRVIAYDREDTVVKLQIIRNGEGIFNFPQEANYYTVELVSAGATEITFHRIDIQEVFDDTDIEKIDFEKMHEENERRRKMSARVVDKFLRRRE